MRITQFFRNKAQEWARKRQGKDRDPTILYKRRIYILPTKLGVGFGLMVFAMLVGSMNYNNSMGFALTFLLASLGLVAMHHCHRNLTGLVIRSAGAESVFEGQNAVFTIAIENPSSGDRYDLCVSHIDGSISSADVGPENRVVLEFSVPTEKRGQLRVSRFNVSTMYPFNLFRAWAWLYLDLSCIVYPRPASADKKPPPQHTDTGGAQDGERGDEDFAGLRTYRPGDSPRHVAWKAFAKEHELLVKQYAGTVVTTHWFDLDSLAPLDVESRLRQICRWVLDAHGEGHAFGVRLTSDVIAPNLGVLHRERCLKALAMFEDGANTEPVGV